MATYSVNTGSDTSMWSASTSLNSDSDTTLPFGEDNRYSSYVYRILSKPTLTLSGAYTISNSNLRIRIYVNFATNTRTLRVYPVLLDWVSNQATWNIWKTSNNWNTAGCSAAGTDYNSTAMGSVSIPYNASGVYDIALTDSVVQGWVTGAKSYYGMILRMDTESNDGHSLHSFNSATDSYKPIFSFDYVASSSVKKAGDVAYASIKKIGDVAIASVKKVGDV